MPKIEKTVFLSYRRQNQGWALAVSKALTSRGYDVFFDYKSLASGDFRRAILENIRARAHFVVLLTPSALERCSRVGDWLRLEIETALEARRNVVPLLLEGFDFAMPEVTAQLTGQLSMLRDYNGLPIYLEYFDPGMDRLTLEYLSVPLEAVSHPVSADVAKTVRIIQAEAAGQAPVLEQELAFESFVERALQSKDVNEQIRFLNEAIRRKSDVPEAFYLRGISRRANTDWGGALEDLSRALGLKPGFVDALTMRGLIRMAQEEHEYARADLDLALSIDPQHLDALVSRGLLRISRGDELGGVADMDKALLMKPDYAEVLVSRAMKKAARGDQIGAREDFNSANVLTVHQRLRK